MTIVQPAGASMVTVRLLPAVSSPSFHSISLKATDSVPSAMVTEPARHLS